ncbi:DUF58 domain-containing protein [Crossiella sp. CA-258035]|uniref:DUF58 domain-containing protein n=1 Tax=Crossiella sp. CA-258035 TaxID=2981138 RepID=UPI0024BC5B42|nr:DUF58 domain-containing protein [Crossiella sp. CA-258035]WHT18010.1 DUF58 domain-containing protein [Crossiella sp. CA-258035]
MSRLTRRGVVVLVLAVLLLTAGVLAGHPLLRALGGLCAGALVAAVALTARRPSVVVTREVYPDRVERGRPALARLLVRNQGQRHQPAFTAADRLGDGQHDVRVNALPPGTEASYHYELPTQRRGRLPVGPLVLERTDPLGLARGRLTAGESATVWVHPRRHPLRLPARGTPRHHHEGRVAEDLHGSLDLREVREYQPGDEVRHLHWKAAARTGQLMVRQYADPDQPRLTLLLDTRSRSLTPDGFEEAVEVAASVLHAAALGGQRCRLVTSGGLDLSTSDGATAARRLLDELCELGQDQETALAPGALARARGGDGALVVVTGGSLDEAVLARLRGRYPATTVVALGVGAGRPVGRLIRAADAAEAVSQWNATSAGRR